MASAFPEDDEKEAILKLTGLSLATTSEENKKKIALSEDDEREEILKLAGLSQTTSWEEDEKKIVVVGNKGCGKSYLVQCFVTEDLLDPEYEISDIYRKRVVCNGMELNMVFRELPSSDSDLDIRARAYPGSVGVFLCFAINDRQSFLDIPKWHQEAKKYVPDAKMFVIGCKMDTRVNDGPVGRKEGKDMGRSVEATKYYECSAVNGHHVAEMCLIIEEKLRS
ncbi:uncharacterized protein NPIL_134941 [Nephila pilipes]|uniref:Uncharacterized protein n=1 Tax=Nephila pilipes TaxID=299642 RepID=A0A8X6P6E4_NEPPI|nr:uncharacterized protein NPIL_134941 [Nephila pilipes]